MTVKNDTHDFIKESVKNLGMELTSNALTPLDNVSFEKLHGILDHEEWFLRDRLIQGIKDAHDARQLEDKGTKKVNKQDIRTAMLMLGTAVAEAPPEVFSNQSTIKDVCPYCR